MTQHASLDATRWGAFSKDQQILMIANEMNRASRFLGAADADSRRLALERVLRLADLTVELQTHPPLRRELLRWRDLAAALYISPDPDPRAHAQAMRALLLLSPLAARQIPHLRLS